MLTSDGVIDETLTLLRLRLGLDAAENWWDAPAASSQVRTELIHAERTERARTIFFRYRDKEFSFADCTSFALRGGMRLRER